jgi:negative regulator of replication initiation
MKQDVLWQELYRAAMLELDHANLEGRIEAAQVAIRQAMEELITNDENAEDRRAMAEALRNLQTLQRLELKNIHAATGASLPSAER